MCDKQAEKRIGSSYLLSLNQRFLSLKVRSSNVFPLDQNQHSMRHTSAVSQNHGTVDSHIPISCSRQPKKRSLPIRERHFPDRDIFDKLIAYSQEDLPV